MRATKIFLFLLILSFAKPSLALDENWGIFQFIKKGSNDQLYFAEFLRRDRGGLFDQRFFDYYRFSWGKRHGDWVYLLGAGYLNFETGPDEKRVHQFLIYQKTWPKVIFTRNRMGLEERFFDQDPHWYLRLRLRNQINFLPQYSWGLAVYNEIFYVPQGHQKFYSGFNENRFGVGPRYTTPEFELYIYYMQNFLRSMQSQSFPTWGQLQIRYNF